MELCKPQQEVGQFPIGHCLQHNAVTANLPAKCHTTQLAIHGIVIVHAIPYWRIIRHMHLYFHIKEKEICAYTLDAPNKVLFFSTLQQNIRLTSDMRLYASCA